MKGVAPINPVWAFGLGWRIEFPPLDNGEREFINRPSWPLFHFSIFLTPGRHFLISRNCGLRSDYLHG